MQAGVQEATAKRQAAERLLQEAEDKANADIFQPEQVNRDRIQVSSYAEKTPVAIHRRRDGGKCNNVTETKDMFKLERILAGHAAVFSSPGHCGARALLLIVQA